jgi:RNA polymerase sigma-70 factor (ECF subfamily)
VDYSSLSPPELFSVCANGGDAAAWEEFMGRFNAVISRSVLRVTIRQGISDNAVVDDLVQETYLKLCANDCKLLKSFTPKYPKAEFAYLKVLATNVAHDYFKSRHTEKRGSDAKCETLDETIDVPSSESPRHALRPPERAVLINQIDRRLVSVVPPHELERARLVFWLYYRVGFTASGIAALPSVGLTTDGVESLLFRLTKLVRDSLVGPPEQSSNAKGLREAESF